MNNSVSPREIYSVISKLSEQQKNKILDVLSTESNSLIFKNHLTNSTKLSNYQIQILQNIHDILGTSKSTKFYLETISYHLHENQKNQTEFHLALTHDEVVDEQEVNLYSMETIDAIKTIVNKAVNQIIIFGYDITWKENPIIPRLKKKVLRDGVRLIVFGDSFRDGKRKPFLQKFVEFWQPDSFDRVKMYTIQHRYKRHSMHAKMALSDGKRGFISSANLTLQGMTKNIEIGILLEGANVKQLNQLADDILNGNRVERYIPQLQ